MGFSFPTEPVGGQSSSETDLRRIVGAQYMTAGILPSGGGTVIGQPDMSYRVRAGAAFMWTDEVNKLGVLVPIDAVTVPTAPAPATGSRTDSVYLAHEGGLGIVRVSSTGVPAGGILLARFVIPAGVTATSGAQQAIDRDYAVHTGGSLGQLAHWSIPGATWGGTTGADVQRYAQQFVVPSDSLVRIDISLAVESATTGEGWTAMGIEIDGEHRRALHCVHVDGMQKTYSATWTAELLRGAHTLTVFTVRFSGPAMKTSGSASASEVNVWHAGPTA